MSLQFGQNFRVGLAFDVDVEPRLDEIFRVEFFQEKFEQVVKKFFRVDGAGRRFHEARKNFNHLVGLLSRFAVDERARRAQNFFRVADFFLDRLVQDF